MGSAPITSTAQSTPQEARIDAEFSGSVAIVRSVLAPRSCALPSCALIPRDTRDPADRDGDGIPEDLDVCPDHPVSNPCPALISTQDAPSYVLETDFAAGSVAFSEEARSMIELGFQLYMEAQITSAGGPYIELQGFINVAEKNGKALLARRIDAIKKALFLAGVEPARIHVPPTSKELLNAPEFGGRVIIGFSGVSLPDPPSNAAPRPIRREPAVAFPPCRFDDQPSSTGQAFRIQRVLRGDTRRVALVVTSLEATVAPPLQLFSGGTLLASIPPLSPGESALIDLHGSSLGSPLISEVTSRERPHALLGIDSRGFARVEMIHTDVTRWRIDPAAMTGIRGVAHPRRRGFRVDSPAQSTVLMPAVVLPFGAEGATDVVVEQGRVHLQERLSEMTPEQLEELARVAPSLAVPLREMAALRRPMNETRAALDRAVSSKDLRKIAHAAKAAREQRERFFALLRALSPYTAPPAPW